MRRFVHCLLLLVVSSMVGAQAQQSGAGASAAPQAAEPVRALVASGRLADLRWPVFSDFQAEVDRFYRPSYGLVWVHDGKATAAAQAVIAILQSAPDEGLTAEDYDGPRWPGRVQLLKGKHTAADEARFDVGLTVCAMRYVSAVRVGRVNPKHVHFAYDVGPKRIDLARFVREELVAGKDARAALAKIEPPYAGYRRAREALLHYMELASGKEEKLPSPGRTLAPGERYDGVPQLALLLRKLGDLPGEVAVSTGENIYGDPVVAAVKHFQERHLLYDDGKIDEPTLQQLNTPLSVRVEQLRLTMERWRWLPLSFPQPPLVVNLPEFYLRGFGPKGKLALTMNVNVGEAYENKTPIFEGNMTYLVFRPYWDVPASIQRDEIVPSVEEDREYIHKYDFEVLSSEGKIVTDGTISDGVLQGLRSGKLRVRQKPGPSNSLGLVKFMFPNVHSVYLHDTPVEKDLFGSGDRDLSHGCIHVKEPAELAAWLLRDQKQWSLQRVNAAMHEGKDNQRINLTKAVPVLILYATAIVEEDGEVYFTTDLYGYDATLAKALAKGYPYPQ
ncbi:MAG TPA: L,D-transpeptidase family protein [Terriglobales bacterium]|nr:L,D-transpeptidase family protein [Terriglobales bacterium]